MSAPQRTAVPGWLRRLHRWIFEHPWATLALVALLLAASAVRVSRARIDQDLGAVLPEGPGSPREAARLLGELGTLNTLLLDLEVPGATQERLAEEGARLAERLRQSGRFAEVHTGPTSVEAMKLGQLLFSKKLYLLDDPAGELERRLGPEHEAVLESSLRSLKLDLASPQALALKGTLLADPLGLGKAALSRFSSMAGEVDAFRGQLLSKDAKHLLIVAVPRKSALNLRASRELLAWLETEATELPSGPTGPARLTVAGGPRFATESAGAIQDDVTLTLLTSAAILAVLFWLRFRGFKLLALAAVALAVGIAGGLMAVVLFRGGLHAMSFGFGAVLLGIAMDYPLYLFNAASADPGKGLDRTEGALEGSWSSMGFGYLTTALAFGALVVSPFPALRELGLFAGGGISVAFVAMLVLMPPLSARWMPAEWPSVPRWGPRVMHRVRLPPRWAWGAMSSLLLLSAVGLHWLQFDGDLRNLDAQRPETLASYQRLLARYGFEDSQSLVVSRGHDVEEALTRNDHAVKAIRASGTARRIQGLAEVLPARGTQRERADALRRLDLSRLRSRLDAVAQRAGFRAGAFEPFWREVEQVRNGALTPLEESDLEGTALEPLKRRFLRCGAEGCLAVTAFGLEAGQGERLAASLPPGAVLLDPGTLAAKTVAQLPRQLLYLCGAGLVLNLLVLIAAYRSLRLALVTCLPCCLGLLMTLATLAVCRVPLNLVSASALVLVLGCGVDYAIFVIQELRGNRRASAVESMGVVLTSTTTLAGFGTLVLAHHRALHSLGLAVGLGIAISSLSAIFILPGLFPALRPRT